MAFEDLTAVDEGDKVAAAIADGVSPTAGTVELIVAVPVAASMDGIVDWVAGPSVKPELAVAAGLMTVAAAPVVAAGFPVAGGRTVGELPGAVVD